MGETEQQSQMRKVQAIHDNRTFVLVIPRDFVSDMKIAKGDYVKCRIDGEQLVVEKAVLQERAGEEQR